MNKLGRINQLRAHMSLAMFLKECKVFGITLDEAGQLLRAIALVNECHWGELRKDGETPYIEHLLVVADTMRRLGFPVSAIIVALLHDIVENCGISIQRIEELFGKEIACDVDALTKKEGVDYFGQLREACKKSFVVIVVKVIDRWHNLTTLYGIRNEEKQLEYLRETIGPLHTLFKECAKYVPFEHREDYRGMVRSVHTIAKSMIK